MAAFPDFTRPSGVDPWLITAEEHAKHDSQFFQLKPIAGYLTALGSHRLFGQTEYKAATGKPFVHFGEQAKHFFLQSGLPTNILGQIWCLSDMDADGRMDRREFSIAMHLIKKILQGFEVPTVLPPSLRSDIHSSSTSYYPLGGGGMGVGGFAPPIQPTPSLFTSHMLPPSYSSVTQPPGSGGMVGVAGSSLSGGWGVPQPSLPPHSGAASSAALPPSGASTGHQPYLNSPIKSSSTTTAGGDWSIPQPMRLKFKQIFNNNDHNHKGYLTGLEAKAILSQSGLVHGLLAQIWVLADIDKDGNLSPDEFCVAMYLIDLAKSGHPLPHTLPYDLIPPSYRKRRLSESQSSTLPPLLSGGLGSGGSADLMSADLATSTADQAGANATTDVGGVVTFEDKRKENFDKGQAELERRRQMLRDQQRRESEERLAQERAENERRERARLEAEQKKQAELERQMEKQRQIEQEKEEQRRKAMEQREAARRELERQRQLEWERQRRDLLNVEKTRELGQVDRLQQELGQLKLELTACSTKKSDMLLRLDNSRLIAYSTAEIEVLRSTYDKKRENVERIQREYEELMKRLEASEHERLKLDRQSKMHTPFSGDADKMLMSSCTSKRESLDRLRSQLIAVETDITNNSQLFDKNNSELLELKAEISALEAECVQLYTLLNNKKTEWRNRKLKLTSASSDAMNQTKNNMAADMFRRQDEDKGKKADPFGDVDWLSDVKPSSSSSLLADSSLVGGGGVGGGSSIVWGGGFNSPALHSTALNNTTPPHMNGRASADTTGGGGCKDSWSAAFNSTTSVGAPPGGTTVEKNAASWASFDNKDPFAPANVSSAGGGGGTDRWSALGGMGGGGGGADDSWASSFMSSAFKDTSSPATNDGGTRASSGSVVKHIALYQFDARSSDELSLAVGDVVWVDVSVPNEEPGWLAGRNAQNVSGCFPAAYVQAVPDETDTRGGEGGGGGERGGDWGVKGGEGDESIYDTLTQPSNRLVSSDITGKSHNSSTMTSSGKGMAPPPPLAATPLAASIDSSFSAVSSSSAPSPKPGQGEAAPDGMRVVAIYPWKAKRDNHLSFNKGDIITVHEQQDIWWSGQLNGLTGWFPKSYVKLLVDDVNNVNNVKHSSDSPVHSVQAVGTSTNSTGHTHNSMTPVNQLSKGPMKSSPDRTTTTPHDSSHLSDTSSISSTTELCVALYAYSSTEPGDLTFNQGDVINLEKSDGDWWTGSLDGRTGIFPASYVEKMESTAVKKLAANQKPEIASVIAPYQGTGIEQLTLQVGQLINVRKKSPSGWWEGELQAKGQKRRVGWFPANYVKLLGSSGHSGASSRGGSPRNIPGASSPANILQLSDQQSGRTSAGFPPPTSIPSVEQVVASFSYQSRQDDELSFSKGSIINVLHKQDADWWRGEQNGRVGMFPANYVQPISSAHLGAPSSSSSSSSPARITSCRFTN